jgi:hypothetical protein
MWSKIMIGHIGLYPKILYSLKIYAVLLECNHMDMHDIHSCCYCYVHLLQGSSN